MEELPLRDTPLQPLPPLGYSIAGEKLCRQIGMPEAQAAAGKMLRVFGEGLLGNVWGIRQRLVAIFFSLKTG